MRREDLRGTWTMEREVVKLLQLVSREGLAGMEVVEVSPPYVADVTALLASRVIMDVLGTLVLNRKLGRNSLVPEGGQQQTNG